MFLLIFLSWTKCSNSQNTDLSSNHYLTPEEIAQGIEKENMQFSIKACLKTAGKEFKVGTYANINEKHYEPKQSTPLLMFMFYQINCLKKAVRARTNDAQNWIKIGKTENKNKQEILLLMIGCFCKLERTFTRFQAKVNEIFKKRFHELNDPDADIKYLHTNYLYNLCVINNFSMCWQIEQYKSKVVQLENNGKELTEEDHKEYTSLLNDLSIKITASIDDIRYEMHSATNIFSYNDVENFFELAKKAYLEDYENSNVSEIHTKKKISVGGYETAGDDYLRKLTIRTNNKVSSYLTKFSTQFKKYYDHKTKLLDNVNSHIFINTKDCQCIPPENILKFLVEWDMDLQGYVEVPYIMDALKLLLILKLHYTELRRDNLFTIKFYDEIKCFYFINLSFITMLRNQLNLLDALAKGIKPMIGVEVNPMKRRIQKRIKQVNMVKQDIYILYIKKIGKFLEFYKDYVTYINKHFERKSEILKCLLLSKDCETKTLFYSCLTPLGLSPMSFTDTNDNHKELRQQRKKETASHQEHKKRKIK